LTIDPTYKGHVKEALVHAVSSCNVPKIPEAERLIKAAGSLFAKIVEPMHGPLTELLGDVAGR
jgi:hypothetical protein